ncbi:hypothetical protein C8Q76DRAFT_791028 [Earliella scabrosa]|nr:hypothetical protein C8Q76DRAFT_791025 [Earliella scabrosa]KAI0740590.1 hypothetical protein C8Q76DRAFT_791028 [Earliella scabrosa]
MRFAGAQRTLTSALCRTSLERSSSLLAAVAVAAHARRCELCYHIASGRLPAIARLLALWLLSVVLLARCVHRFDYAHTGSSKLATRSIAHAPHLLCRLASDTSRSASHAKPPTGLSPPSPSPPRLCIRRTQAVPVLNTYRYGPYVRIYPVRCPSCASAHTRSHTTVSCAIKTDQRPVAALTDVLGTTHQHSLAVLDGTDPCTARELVSSVERYAGRAVPSSRVSARTGHPASPPARNSRLLADPAPAPLSNIALRTVRVPPRFPSCRRPVRLPPFLAPSCGTSSLKLTQFSAAPRAHDRVRGETCAQVQALSGTAAHVDARTNMAHSGASPDPIPLGSRRPTLRIRDCAVRDSRAHARVATLTARVEITSQTVDAVSACAPARPSSTIVRDLDVHLNPEPGPRLSRVADGSAKTSSSVPFNSSSSSAV